MIEINLLPEELKKTALTREKIPLTFILLCAAGLMLALLLIMSAVTLANKIVLRALDSRLQSLDAGQKRITEIRGRIASFKADNEAYAQLFTAPFLWSRALNTFSDALLPGIWFNSVAVQKEAIGAKARTGKETSVYGKVLVVNGTAVALQANEMTLISDYIRNLKANGDFFLDFASVELESVLRRKIQTVEAMDFNLLFRFKEGVEF